jgi:carboxymethylenebutenolidase
MTPAGNAGYKERSRLAAGGLILLWLLAAGCGRGASQAATSPVATRAATQASRSTSAPASTPAPSATSQPQKQKVTYKNGDLTLTAILFKPAGPGPFPAVVWNHGSEQDPENSAQFDTIASVFVPAGYVVIAPERRGQSSSQGPYILDALAQVRAAGGPAAQAQYLVQQMEGTQLDDQLAGLTYLKGLSYVDESRIVVAGCSYGGIQTLLAAERGAGYRAAVAISPAAESWDSNKPLQDRLIKAVDGTTIPVFLIHPAKDVSLAPGMVLGAEFQRLGKPYQLKIYPPSGNDTFDGHCFGGFGPNVPRPWAADVVAFLAGALLR